VRGGDERRVDARRDQARRHEEVRVHDVRLRGGAHTLRKFEVAELPAAAPVEDGEIDLVTAPA